MYESRIYPLVFPEQGADLTSTDWKNVAVNILIVRLIFQGIWLYQFCYSLKYYFDKTKQKLKKVPEHDLTNSSNNYEEGFNTRCGKGIRI